MRVYLEPTFLAVKWGQQRKCCSENQMNFSIHGASLPQVFCGDDIDNNKGKNENSLEKFRTFLGTD